MAVEERTKINRIVCIKKANIENEQLVSRLNMLNKEFCIRKEIFIAQAGSNGQQTLQQMKLAVLEDDSSTENYLSYRR